MEDFSKFIGYIVVFFVAIFGVGMLNAHILLDVAKLFKVPYVSELVFSQAYGLTIVVGLLRGAKVKKDQEDDYNPYVKVLLGVILLLAVWGIAYMAHGLFF